MTNPSTTALAPAVNTTMVMAVVIVVAIFIIVVVAITILFVLALFQKWSSLGSQDDRAHTDLLLPSNPKGV